ncbi:MAG: chemotaxis protein CheA [Candidatus Heimdallarchaeaceae archaeon]
MSDIEQDEFKDVLILELDERVQDLEQVRIRYTKDPGDITLKEDLLRTLHSVKGLFSLAGYPKISTLAHHFETFVVEGEFQLSEQLMNMLTRFSDELDNLSKALKTNNKPNILRFDQLTQQLATIDEFLVNLSNQLQIMIVFKPNCKVASARTLVLIDKLKQVATINSYNPPLEEIQEGASFRELILEIATQEDEDTIRTICEDIQDVDKIQISRQLDSVGVSAEMLDTVADSLNVRVKLRDLDVIIRLLGDLVVYGQFIREIGEQESFTRDFRENLLNFERTITNIQDLVIRMRLVPLETILNRFPRMIRELSTQENKETESIISGKYVGVDRSIIEQLVDPLTHIVRNAVSHGIETSKERKKKGKPSIGLINLNVTQERSDIIIEVRDDGRGIDYDAVKKNAIAAGVMTKGQKLTKEELNNLLLTTSFTTSEKTTEISGRGVGLTAVKKSMEQIGGNIEIESEANTFTSFRMIIPLSVAINKVLLLTVKGHQFALPMDDIQQILSVPRNKIYHDSTTSGNCILVNEQPVPIVNLRKRFQFNRDTDTDLDNNLEDVNEQDTEIVILWKKRELSLGFIVDDLLGERDVVIKPIQDFLKQIGAFSSATVLEGGQVVLIIEPMNFLEVGMNV